MTKVECPNWTCVYNGRNETGICAKKGIRLKQKEGFGGAVIECRGYSCGEEKLDL